MNKNLLENIKKSIVFIGKIFEDKEGNKKESFLGTGALCGINNIFYLLTAKHVILDKQTGEVNKNLFIFLNLKNTENPVKGLSIKDLYNQGLEFIFHEDLSIDLALIPFPVDFNTDDIKLVDIENSIGTNDLYETNDIFYGSYQPGISSLEYDGNIKPIIRKGAISKMNNDKTFYIDGAAFPGNSGSPLFLMPSAIKFTDNGISMGGDNSGGKFIGIISQNIPYQETAISSQTGRPRIIFEENTGLSYIYGIDLIKEIINQDNFKEQEKNLTQNI